MCVQAVQIRFLSLLDYVQEVPGLPKRDRVYSKAILSRVRLATSLTSLYLYIVYWYTCGTKIHKVSYLT